MNVRTRLPPDDAMPTETETRIGLPRTLDEAHASILSLVEDLEDDKHRVDELTRRLYGRKAERFDPNRGTLFELGDEAAAAEETGPEAEPEPQPAARRKGHGRRKLPKDLPRKRVEHDLDPAERRRPQCGGERARIGEETSEQLDDVPASVFVVEHVRFKYACRHCQEEVATAARPPQPIEKGLPGSGMLAQTVVNKYADHLPPNRQVDVFARHGIDLHRSTLCDWAMVSAELLEPVALAMRRKVLESAVVHTDDTPVQVLVSKKKKRKASHRGYVWVYVGDEDHPYDVYDFTWTRSRAGPEAFLDGYEGYLQADAFAGYERSYASGKGVEVGCWAHARRKFFEAKSSKWTEANLALNRIGDLYAVEKEAKDKEPDEVLALREKKSVPMLNDFRVWLEALYARELPKSPIGQAAAYALGNWDALTRYASDLSWTSTTTRPSAPFGLSS
jgi:transposase